MKQPLEMDSIVYEAECVEECPDKIDGNKTIVDYTNMECYIDPFKQEEGVGKKQKPKNRKEHINQKLDFEQNINILVKSITKRKGVGLRKASKGKDSACSQNGFLKKMSKAYEDTFVFCMCDP